MDGTGTWLSCVEHAVVFVGGMNRMVVYVVCFWDSWILTARICCVT
jgi:hypothetical protein